MFLGLYFKTISVSSQRAPRKYSCEFCNYSSNDASNYRRHKMVHTQERPFKCPICSKGFNYKANLKEHIFTHSSNSYTAC